MNVILTYVRGLGVPKFNEENMTELKEKTLQKGGLFTYYIKDIILKVHYTNRHYCVHYFSNS